MLIDLDPLELATAARGARCIARQERADAEKCDSYVIRCTLLKSAEWTEQLVEKLERARATASAG